jgi:hypothetical protein
MAPLVDEVGAETAGAAPAAVGEVMAETMAVDAGADMVDGTGVVRGGMVILVLVGGPIIAAAVGSVTAVSVMGVAGGALVTGAAVGLAAAAVAVTVAGMAVVAPTTLLAFMKMPLRESGLSWYCGSTSITTKY